MARIPTIDAVDAASPAVRPLLDAVQDEFGRVPNMVRVLARSPAALQGYLALDGALRTTALPPATRTRIALAIAERNGCAYCLSAHTHSARTAAKLNDAEITANRNGASNDLQADAAVRFALALERARGAVSDAELAAFKAAGHGDTEAIEIAALVALNTLGNTVNQLARTEVDFPVVTARATA
jgi:uncharacterized peroxidase-related enzyme